MNIVIDKFVWKPNIFVDLTQSLIILSCIPLSFVFLPLYFLFWSFCWLMILNHENNMFKNILFNLSFTFIYIISIFYSMVIIIINLLFTIWLIPFRYELMIRNWNMLNLFYFQITDEFIELNVFKSFLELAIKGYTTRLFYAPLNTFLILPVFKITLLNPISSDLSPSYIDQMYITKEDRIWKTWIKDNYTKRNHNKIPSFDVRYNCHENCYSTGIQTTKWFVYFVQSKCCDINSHENSVFNVQISSSNIWHSVTGYVEVNHMEDNDHHISHPMWILTARNSYIQKYFIDEINKNLGAYQF